MNHYKQCTAHEYNGRKALPGHPVAPGSGHGRSWFKVSRSRRARQFSGLIVTFVITVIERYNDPNTAMKHRHTRFIILNKITYLH